MQVGTGHSVYGHYQLNNPLAVTTNPQQLPENN